MTEVDKQLMIKGIYKSFNYADYENKPVLGDFNFRNINWDDPTTKRNRCNDQDFIDTIQNNFLTQIMDLPARGDNILDLISTSDQKAQHNQRPN